MACSFGKPQALYQVTVLLVLNFRGKSILNLKHDNAAHANKVKNTLIFNTFVICQVRYGAKYIQTELYFCTFMILFTNTFCAFVLIFLIRCLYSMLFYF